MTPEALLDRLTALFPDFRAHWGDPGNCFRDDDGSYTLHGVFAEFTSFYRDRAGWHCLKWIGRATVWPLWDKQCRC